MDIKTDGSLKVKICTLVITSCEVNSNSKGKVKDEEEVSSNHVIVLEDDNLKAEVEPAKVPKTLKGEGQAIVDELKELNLRTKEDSHPI